MKILTNLRETFSKKINIFNLICGVVLLMSLFYATDLSLFSLGVYSTLGIMALSNIWVKSETKLHNLITWIGVGIMSVTGIVSVILWLIKD